MEVIIFIESFVVLILLFIILHYLNIFHKIKTKGITNYVCDRLKNVSQFEIIEHHKKVEKITQINLGIYEPTSCGTVANAMLSIVPYIIHPESFYYDLLNTIICKQRLKISRLLKIIKTHKNNNRTYVYNIGTNCRDIYKNNLTSSFSGHAFTIIKLNNGEFVFTQSYIEQYEHNDCVKKMSFGQIKKIITKFIKICNARKITDEFCKLWKELTEISIDDLKTFSTSNNQRFGGEFIYSVL